METILYSPDSINVLLFYAINHFQQPWVPLVMKLGSVIGKYELFPAYFAIFVIAAWKKGVYMEAAGNVTYYRNYRKKMMETGLLLLIAYVVYIAWVSGLKHLLHMPRPFVRLPEGSVFILETVKNSENPYVSFPSGHSAFVMMMLVTLWSVLNSQGRTIGIGLLLWVGISRISLGLHFPSDVTGSWVLSFIVTYYTVKLCKPLVHKTLLVRLG